MLSRVRWRSLQFKIIAWSFVPTIIILGAVALMSLYAYQRVTEKLVVERDRDLTRLSASLLGAELSSYTDPLSDQFLSVFDSGMVIFDGRGKILTFEPERLEGWGADWARRISFQGLVRSTEPVFSDVVVGGQEGENAVVVYVPIIGRDGEYVGGVAGVFRLEATGAAALYESVKGLAGSESKQVYLVDGKGVVIYHSDPAYIGKDLSDQAVVRQLIGGGAGAERTIDLEGGDIVASFAPVPDTPWGLVMEENWTALIAPSRRYGHLLLLLLLLGITVPALIVGIGVRRITGPVASLIRAARQVAEGDFGQRIAASTGDEIEELAGQFNLMAIRLQESYDHLERKVADRTRELATLNTLASVVSRSLDMVEILNDALDQALSITSIAKGQALLLEEDEQCLKLVAHRSLSDEFVRDCQLLPLDSSHSGPALQQGIPICTRAADCDDRHLRDLLKMEKVEMMVSIPLVAKERVVGLIELDSTAWRPVAKEELDLLAAIGQQIGVAVENAQLHEHAQQLAVIKERNRLARDLHDSVMQALYGVTLYAEAAGRQIASGELGLATEHLREIRASAQESLREMRLLIFQLRPPLLKEEGLVSALRSRLEAVEGRIGMETQFHVVGYSRQSSEIEEGLYRVALEALNNALRHAHASVVTVRLGRSDGCVALEVTDNGSGFDVTTVRQRGGFGLQGMEERIARLGGKLIVHSHSGKGTTIRAEVHV